MYQVAMQLDLISHWLYSGLFLLCKVGCELFSLRLASGTGDKAGWACAAKPYYFWSFRSASQPFLRLQPQAISRNCSPLERDMLQQ